MEKVEKKAHVWERDPFDWYTEPPRATKQLLAVEKFDGVIYDPACGQGNVVTTCLAAGLPAYGADIVRRVPDETEWFAGTHDFLELGVDRPTVANIITNPPFYRARGAEAFIRHALDIATHKVAAFVDARFLFGDGRARGLYRDRPPSRIWIVAPRPSCPPGALPALSAHEGSGTADFAWLVWSHDDLGQGTKIGWLTKDMVR